MRQVQPALPLQVPPSRSLIEGTACKVKCSEVEYLCICDQFHGTSSMLALLCCLLYPLYCFGLTTCLHECFEHENVSLILKQTNGLFSKLGLC